MSNLVNIGFGNYVSLEHIVAVVDPESNPIKRVVSQARENGRLVDATYGRKTRAVIVADSGHVILCPLLPDTLSQRIAGKTGGDNSEG